MLRYAISLITLFALAPAVQAAGRVDALPPPALGSYPMACSNLAIDDAKLAQSGVSGADLWTGIIRNGQTHYLAEALAEPASAFSAPISPPNDKALYPRFANQTVPLVSLFCYPTTPDNPRPAYRLPDGPSLPHMERSGDAPLFADAAQRYPLIVFSHGMGGSPVDGDTLSLLAALVSKGYAVLAPFHGDQRIGVVQIKDLGDVWKLVRNFDQYVELQAMRPLGIRSALDTLLSRPDYAAHIDAQRIGGFGASLGGEAMMLAMGARLTTTLLLDSRSVTTEPRLKAVVGYIPYSGQSILPAFGLGQDGAAQARGPYLALSGSADIIAPTDMSRKALQKMQGSRYLVELQGVPHGFKASYAADVLGWLLPFYDAYLNDQPEALDRLSRTSSVAGGLDDRLLIDIAAPAPASAGQVDVVEFFNDKSGNYLNVVGAAEVALLQQYAGQGWRATGQSFKAWQPGTAGTQPVCRYYRANGSSLLDGGDALFYASQPELCALGQSLAPTWQALGAPIALASPEANGRCAPGSQLINRAMRVGSKPGELNFRFSTSESEVRLLQQQGWQIDGSAMCAPL